jgi:hypothetical protein
LYTQKYCIISFFGEGDHLLFYIWDLSCYRPRGKEPYVLARKGLFKMEKSFTIILLFSNTLLSFTLSDSAFFPVELISF